MSDASSVANREVSYFIIEEVDARRMYIEEGMLAKSRGNTDDIRKYAEMMIHDHTTILNDLTMLAKAQNIKLPETLSDEKAKGLLSLKEKQGKEFDRKFIKMMIIDHRQDLREFEKAAAFKDHEVQKFAKHYRAIIQSHLEIANNLKYNH